MTTATHTHHYLIPSPKGPGAVIGRCKNCSAEKEFSNSIDLAGGFHAVNLRECIECGKGVPKSMKFFRFRKKKWSETCRACEESDE